jgi:hypothetical protein
MNNYKIKINCTSYNDLNYNNKKITKNNCEVKLLKEYNNYINNIYILYKRKKNEDENNFTTKTLEFRCNKELNKIEFETFIKYMKDIGFNSKNKKNKNKNNKIEFIDINLNIPIFEYDFILNTETEIKKKNKKKNNSIYSTQILI